MKKHLIWILAIVAIIGIVLFFVFINNKNGLQQQRGGTPGTKISTNVNEDKNKINEQQAENRIANIIANSNEINKNATSEKELSTFSTPIKDKSAGRLTNIGITCSTLTNTIIKPGEIFSFNKVVGKPTAERGYQEASVIIDHKTEKGIGGGNCQVSSTLYNAVLAIPNLKVTERHEHGKDVTYVPEGKDAAVSYGSLDLKFRNNTGKDIRIEAANDSSSITIRIVQL